MFQFILRSFGHFHCWVRNKFWRSLWDELTQILGSFATFDWRFYDFLCALWLVVKETSSVIINKHFPLELAGVIYRLTDIFSNDDNFCGEYLATLVWIKIVFPSLESLKDSLCLWVFSRQTNFVAKANNVKVFIVSFTLLYLHKTVTFSDSLCCLPAYLITLQDRV